MPGSPGTLLILIRLLWPKFRRFWMTKNFRVSEFFGSTDLSALDLEGKSAWVFPGASHQVSVIPALMANELTACRTTASIPPLFTNGERDEPPHGPALPRQITSFLRFTQNTHCCTKAAHEDNGMQHAQGEVWQQHIHLPLPLLAQMTCCVLEEPNAASNHSPLLGELQINGLQNP